MDERALTAAGNCNLTLKNTGRQKVQLTRVEFEDGGVWKATEADGRKP